MNRESVKTGFAWAFIAVAVFVMITTLRGRYRTGPLVPQLVPVFGFVFAAVFVALQAAACLGLDMKMGLAWIAGMLLLGLLLGSFGQAMHSYEGVAYDWTRHKIVAGACVSGLVLGILILKSKV